LPLLTRAHQEEKWQLKVREIIKKGGVILSGGGMVVLGGTLIAAPLIIQLLTQKRFEEFKEAISVLRILAVAVFLAHFNHLTGYTLVALGQQKKYLKIPVLALILNIGLNFLLVPRWSYFAAAWVTVVTEIVVLSWSIMMLKRVLRE
jgi:O-antigen/teichoic acid export membrane protein